MSGSENLLQTVKTISRIVVAPDVRELKVRMGSLDRRIDSLDGQMKAQFDAVKTQLEAQKKQSEAQYEALKGQSAAQFKAVLAAIGQSKAETELSTFKQIAALGERVAALEAHMNHP